MIVLKYKVIKLFRDMYTKGIYEPGDLFESGDVNRVADLQKRKLIASKPEGEKVPEQPKEPKSEDDDGEKEKGKQDKSSDKADDGEKEKSDDAKDGEKPKGK